MKNRRLSHEETKQTKRGIALRNKQLTELHERLIAEEAQLEIIRLNRLVTTYQNKHQLINGRKTIDQTNNDIRIEFKAIAVMQDHLKNGVPTKK